MDITHGIARYDVRQGALVLRNTLPYMPVGVHVAVVDPQVGTERRAVALRTADGRILVGPDNGLLSLAWERCGGRRPGGGRDALAAPARAGVGHLPRPRHLRAGGRAPGRAARSWPTPATRSTRRRSTRVELPRAARWRTARVVAHALRDRPLRQRRPRTWTTTTGRHRHHARRHGRGRGGAASATLATYAQTFADVRAGRAARLRGRLPHARAGDQPRRRRRARSALRAGRRGAAAAAMIGTPRVHHRLTDSTNERARSSPRRARRTARWSPPTSRRPAAAARAAPGPRRRGRRC